MLDAGALSAPEQSPFFRVETRLRARVWAGLAAPAVACVVDRLSADGVTVVVESDAAAHSLPRVGMIDVPSLGQYRARRLDINGKTAEYRFDLSAPARRALDTFIRTRFCDAQPG